MKTFRTRATTPEIIDLGPEHYTSSEYDECLAMLAKIGKWLRGDRISLKAIGHYAPKTILDVGCGGGDFAHKLAKAFPNTLVLGMDIDSEAISRANRHFSRPNLTFKQGNIHDFSPQSFDVVTTTLVCHHLDDQTLVPFVQQLAKMAKNKLVINDLHRSRSAYVLFAIVSRLFFRNRLIWHDGLLSIQKGFKREDWETLLDKAKIVKEKACITWKWPFRWCVEIG